MKMSQAEEGRYGEAGWRGEERGREGRVRHCTEPGKPGGAERSPAQQEPREGGQAKPGGEAGAGPC